MLLKEVQSTEQWLESVGIEKYRIGADGKVNVNGNVILTRKKMPGGRFPVKFGKVTGTFNCEYTGLTTLEGAPEFVGKSFFCTFNNIKTIEFLPRHIGETCGCSENQITSLHNVHRYVRHVQRFYLRTPEITSSVLGLFLIKGLEFYNVNIPEKADEIVWEYFERGGDDRRSIMLLCQNALIEAGFANLATT